MKLFFLAQTMHFPTKFSELNNYYKLFYLYLLKLLNKNTYRYIMSRIRLLNLLCQTKNSWVVILSIRSPLN